MIIHGEIQSASHEQYKDKAGNERKSVRILIMDRSKHFRCLTPFMINLTPDDFASIFGKKTPGELADEKATLVVTKLQAFGDYMNCPHGQIRLGHLNADVFNAPAGNGAAK